MDGHDERAEDDGDYEVACGDDDDDAESKCVGKIVRSGGPSQTVRVVLFPDIRPACLLASVLPRLQTLANSELQKIQKIHKYKIPDTGPGCLVASFLQNHQRCANSEMKELKRYKHAKQSPKKSGQV